MNRTKSLERAIELAAERGLAYGFCVLDGWHYVGTREQLERIACVDISSTPSGPSVAECDEILGKHHYMGAK